jgi:hypothetical protein
LEYFIEINNSLPRSNDSMESHHQPKLLSF